MSQNKFPSEEQRKVLESSSRVTIVKAVPGSGKTSVFIELFKKNLLEHGDRKKGIAALSFTNAAYEEINRRLGIPIGPQHFVSTLDSFLFRFVIKPFAVAIGLKENGISLLLPPLDETITAHPVYFGSNPQDKISAYALKFTSGTVQTPTFSARNGFSNITLTGIYASEALKKKKEIWRTRGLITHSDCHYLSALILSDPRIGPKIRKMIATRFPVILVDEFQDTGNFLSLALKEILTEASVRSLVVGDPDQSIYEFSGATPQLFTAVQGLNGANTLAIEKSQRCSKAICDIARNLSDTKSNLVSNNDLVGRQIIFVHNYPKINKIESKLMHLISGLPDVGKVAVLARSNKLIRQLSGDNSDIYFLGRSAIGEILADAMTRFNQGKTEEAFKLVSSRMTMLLFEDESLTRRELEERNILYPDWKKQIFLFLKEISKEVNNESWNDWLIRAKVATQSFLKNFGSNNLALGQKFRKDNDDGNKIKGLVTPSPMVKDEVIKNADFKTVHAAKGAEYDTVVVYYPKPHAKHAPCISTTWFQNSGSTEEKRIGYVAVTRARKNIILCIHQETYTALNTSQSDFVKKFEVILN